MADGPTVALDGFGAEQGFEVLAEGARIAAADGIRLRVFGPGRELGLDGVEGVEVVPTAEWIGNEEDPVPAVRAKKQASVVRAARDISEGGSAAMVSPGSTGATMAAATFGLRRLKGVQRPALAVRLPVPGKPVLFLDVGANVEVRAQHLVQFAFLGAAFSEAVLGVAGPRVGLLSVGEESGKGREEVSAAHALLSRGRGDRVRRQRRGWRPAGRRGRRRRHRRLHRQRRAEADGGNGEDRHRGDPRRGPLQPAGDSRRPAAAARARRPAA